MHTKYIVRPYYFFVKIINLECTALIAFVNKLDLKADVDANIAKFTCRAYYIYSVSLLSC